MDNLIAVLLECPVINNDGTFSIFYIDEKLLKRNFFCVSAVIFVKR